MYSLKFFTCGYFFCDKLNTCSIHYIFTGVNLVGNKSYLTAYFWSFHCPNHGNDQKQAIKFITLTGNFLL